MMMVVLLVVVMMMMTAANICGRLTEMDGDTVCYYNSHMQKEGIIPYDG